MDLSEIPVNKDITYLGLTTYRDQNQVFGIKRADRRQHVYVLGKSGTGKSALLSNMIFQNIQNGEGVCVVDPHGELVESILSAIPRHRVKDVIYFNPADTDYHIGFNVLELVDSQYKHLVASGLMGIFTKIWANAWSARMEYILNNTILALLDTPGTTLLGIPRMLVDKDYRQKIIGNLKDPVIKAFWVHEYEAWQDKFRNEAIAPIQNKVGQFLSTSIIRNVVGQSKSTINIFNMMNEGKIFLVNVSKGRIGEDNSALLGGMIITKIQLAAMERVRIPEEERRDFYLYVDEFQNFVTDAFAGILSEARKYRLNLTVAHQYTAQLISDKSSAVRDAVFGNVGTIIVFRVGADDADFLEKEFEPEFIPQDIVNLPNYKIYLKLMIDGVTSRPFSAKTLPPMVKSGDKNIADEVIRSSRELYCLRKEDIEREINQWSGMSLGEETEPSPSGEKFPIICSLCGLEKTVPFKPVPGRPVYCKECIGKIKEGTAKPVRGGREERAAQNEAEFFEPLAALGIEFKAEKKEASAPRTASRSGGSTGSIKRAPGPRTESPDPRQTSSKDFRPKLGENTGLKAALAKAFEKPGPAVVPAVEKKKEPEPISLETLKNKMQNLRQSATAAGPRASVGKDRAASEADMSKLKNLISTKIGTSVPPKEPTPQTPPSVPATPVSSAPVSPPSVPLTASPVFAAQAPAPQALPESPVPLVAQPAPTSAPSSIPDPKPLPAPERPESSDTQTPRPKEVPEDVLRKILE